MSWTVLLKLTLSTPTAREVNHLPCFQCNLCAEEVPDLNHSNKSNTSPSKRNTMTNLSISLKSKTSSRVLSLTKSVLLGCQTKVNLVSSKAPAKKADRPSDKKMKGSSIINLKLLSTNNSNPSLAPNMFLNNPEILESLHRSSCLNKSRPLQEFSSRHSNPSLNLKSGADLIAKTTVTVDSNKLKHLGKLVNSNRKPINTSKSSSYRITRNSCSNKHPMPKILKKLFQISFSLDLKSYQPPLSPITCHLLSPNNTCNQSQSSLSRESPRYNHPKSLEDNQSTSNPSKSVKIISINRSKLPLLTSSSWQSSASATLA